MEACIRMNKFGIISSNRDSNYCKNRSILDAFMNEPVLKYTNKTSDTTRSN